jgi:hypothetical protein
MRHVADVWECEYQDCKHVWLAVSEVAPRQCARCKRLNWHRSPAVPAPDLSMHGQAETPPMSDLDEVFARARAGRQVSS